MGKKPTYYGGNTIGRKSDNYKLSDTEKICCYRAGNDTCQLDKCTNYLSKCKYRKCSHRKPGRYFRIYDNGKNLRKSQSTDTSGYRAKIGDVVHFRFDDGIIRPEYILADEKKRSVYTEWAIGEKVGSSGVYKGQHFTIDKIDKKNSSKR